MSCVAWLKRLRPIGVDPCMGILKSSLGVQERKGACSRDAGGKASKVEWAGGGRKWHVQMLRCRGGDAACHSRVQQDTVRYSVVQSRVGHVTTCLVCQQCGAGYLQTGYGTVPVAQQGICIFGACWDVLALVQYSTNRCGHVYRCYVFCSRTLLVGTRHCYLQFAYHACQPRGCVGH